MLILCSRNIFGMAIWSYLKVKRFKITLCEFQLSMINISSVILKWLVFALSKWSLFCSFRAPSLKLHIFWSRNNSEVLKKNIITLKTLQKNKFLLIFKMIIFVLKICSWKKYGKNVTFGKLPETRSFTHIYLNPISTGGGRFGPLCWFSLYNFF